MPGPPPLPSIAYPDWLQARDTPAPVPAGGGTPAPAPPAPPAVVEVKYNAGITIKGPQDFVDKTKAHLDTIAKTATGADLLKSLADSGQVAVIVPTTGGNAATPDDWTKAIPKDEVLKWKDSTGTEHSLTGVGGGSGTKVEYNPDRKVIAGGTEDWQTRPPEIGLAHELIHADDAAHGKMDPEQKDGTYNYERQAVGLPPYEDKEFTENKIRAEWDPVQPKRPRY
jgi:hypothetical protein